MRQENSRLKLEKETLRKAAAYFCQRVDLKYAWIAAAPRSLQRQANARAARHPAFVVRLASKRAPTDAQLTDESRRQQRCHRGRYGRQAAYGA